MKINATCMHVQTVSSLDPRTNSVRSENFAVFESKDGSAIKLALPKEELDKLTPKKEYTFEFSYEECAGLLLPSVAAPASS